MRPLLLVLASWLLPACAGGPPAAPTVPPLDRAREAAGPGTVVEPFRLGVPGAEAFLVSPDPPMLDYDRFDALLVPTAGGTPLGGTEALRFIWEAGVRDPDTLGLAAAVFVAGSRRLATEEDRAERRLQNFQGIVPPALNGTTLTVWIVREGMRREAAPITVDFATLTVTLGP